MAICELDDVKDCLGGIQSGDDDGYIERLIARAGAFIDDQTGRQFVAVTETRYYDPTDEDFFDGAFLYLDKDLVSITTLTNGDGDVLTAATEYIKLPVNDAPPYSTIKLIETGGISWTYDDDPEIAVSILGSWGYQATVPKAIEEAGALQAAWYYRAREAGPDADRTIIANGVVIAPAVVPGLVEEMIAPYRVKYQ